jgi:hypothetical protein
LPRSGLKWQYRIVRRFYYALSSVRSCRRWLPVLRAGAAITAAGCGSAAPGSSSGMASQQRAAAANPDLDPGSSLGGVKAPNFTLTSQF